MEVSQALGEDQMVVNTAVEVEALNLLQRTALGQTVL
jgi:hypothetical protein